MQLIWAHGIRIKEIDIVMSNQNFRQDIDLNVFRGPHSRSMETIYDHGDIEDQDRLR